MDASPIIVLSFLFQGGIYGVLGASLPDLQCEFNTDVAAMSRLFLVFGLAATVGTLLSIPCFRRVHPYLMLATCMAMFCAGCSAVDSSGNIHVAQAALLLTGVSSAMLSIGSAIVAKLLLPKGEKFFHVLYAASSAGSLLYSALTGQFMGKPTAEASAEALFGKETRSSFHMHSLTMPASTSLDEEARHILVNISQYSNGSSGHYTYCEETNSAVVFMYVLLGVVGVPAFIVFCVLYTCRSRMNCDIAVTECKDKEDPVTRTTLHDAVIFTLTLAFVLFAYGTTYAFTSYLTTIGAEQDGSEGVDSMIVLVSMYWLLFLAGRLVGVAVGYCLSQTAILWISLLFSLLGMLVVAISNVLGSAFLWAGALVVAFFVGPANAAIMAWTGSRIHLSPRVIGYIYFADYMGSTLLPYVSGQLISWYGTDVFKYYCFGLILFQATIFSVMNCVSRYMRDVPRYTKLDIDVEE